jgi:hypothetical protein
VAPNHVLAGFSAVTCGDCHTTTAWSGGRFDHTSQTTYRLAGDHRTMACSKCHAAGAAFSTPTTCTNCHRDEHRGQNGTNCARCHNTSTWGD